jgi:hypothetical protein
MGLLITEACVGERGRLVAKPPDALTRGTAALGVRARRTHGRRHGRGRSCPWFHCMCHCLAVHCNKFPMQSPQTVDRTLIDLLTLYTEAHADWDLSLKRRRNSNANLRIFMPQMNSESKFDWQIWTFFTQNLKSQPEYEMCSWKFCTTFILVYFLVFRQNLENVAKVPDLGDGH